MECKIHIHCILEITSYKKKNQTNKKIWRNKNKDNKQKTELNQEAIYKAKQKPLILQSQSSSSQSNALLCSVGDGGQQQ